ncbi:MAG: type III-A CRISPR-associated protein Csm2 [Sideroxydans sp.]
MPQPNRNFQQRPTAPVINVDDVRLGNISDELYASIAEAKARFIADNSNREANKSTQLRHFYDELVLWNEKINGRGTKEERNARYQELAPLIKMLNAKVVYAEGRKHVDKNFVTLFRHVLGQVNNPRTLEQAKLFFEAFMGFYKAYKG